MTYYVTKGENRFSKSGRPIPTGLRRFDNIVDARKYAITLTEKYRDRDGYFIDPKTKNTWEVGLGVTFILRSLKGEEIGNVQYGQPNLAFPKGYYWHTVERYESHWSLLNKDGTIKKKYR